jgi:hypothetical protein
VGVGQCALRSPSWVAGSMVSEEWSRVVDGVS